MSSDLLERFYQKDRLALAKVITIIESKAERDQVLKTEILNSIFGNPTSLRLAISGPPGVGKSTFINVLGQKLVGLGLKLAILPIDPSSVISGGSILGDKMRMQDLTMRDDVYIRPSPSSGILGGVALATRDVMLAVEAFGFDCVLIETVGVGQSETLAYLLCDHYIVLSQPGSGDQLQAMKKGILELADYILITKADGEQENLARKTKDSLKSLALGMPNKKPFIDLISSLTGKGISEVLTHLTQSHQTMIAQGALSKERTIKRHDFVRSALIENLAFRIAEMKPVTNDLVGKEETSLSLAIDERAAEIIKKIK